jgi:hypothetical protein
MISRDSAGARIVLNPQRLDGSNALRVGTTRAPHTTRADEKLDRKPVRQHCLLSENASARFAIAENFVELAGG